jgi:hypothetical protein
VSGCSSIEGRVDGEGGGEGACKSSIEGRGGVGGRKTSNEYVLVLFGEGVVVGVRRVGAGGAMSASKRWVPLMISISPLAVSTIICSSMLGDRY